MLKLFHNKKGTTFIELLLYIAIFLIITPILINVAIDYLRASKNYNVEKSVNTESQIVAERVYDVITEAKRVNLASSVLNDPDGKLVLVMQDDSEITVKLNPETNSVEITENGLTSNLTGEDKDVKSLYFEKNEDVFGSENIALGINIKMVVAGEKEDSIEQEVILSANLERGDYDDDGCPDFIDLYPTYPECCGDADVDGSCDELDNCILTYNPFQEDNDSDGVGDACDSGYLPGGGGGGGGTAFNCSSDDNVMSLLTQTPPIPSWVMKQILISSSPLSPDVLQALIDAHPLLSDNHFAMIMSINTELDEDIYDNIMAMDNLDQEYKDWIAFAQATSEWIAWQGYNQQSYMSYNISFASDAPPEEDWTNKIIYSNAADNLCSGGTYNRGDLFMINVDNGSDSVDVTTTTASGPVTVNLSTSNNEILNSQGFNIKLNNIVDDEYALLVESEDCTEDLISVEFDFGTGADITNPSSTSQDVSRFTSYCGGGCAYNCGDVGSGIVTTYDGIHDTCYKANGSYPEWCSAWFAFNDDDVGDPPYVGGTQTGEEQVWWEKLPESILTEEQLENLQSITVGGEIAYQDTTQFFCDAYGGSCPMEAYLVGDQKVQLYNYVTHSWTTIGYLETDGSTSDQQAFEIIYDGEDVLDYVQDGTNQIRARMEFHWDGESGSSWWWWGGGNDPAFMLIDYFTVHLKW